MPAQGARLIFGVERHFFFMMLFLTGWGCFLCLPGMAVPVGTYWWDYLAVKGLEHQLFDGPEGVRELWLPYLLPLVLFRLANVVAGSGIDYFFAHLIVAASTLVLGYKAIYLRLDPQWRVPFYWVLLLFSIFPVNVDLELVKSFKDTNAVAYNGFYNRYLDVIFSLLLVSVLAVRDGDTWGRAKNDRWMLLFWCYALVVALLSKLTYFFVFWVFLWAFAVLRRNRAAVIPCLLAIPVVLVVALIVPNYFVTNWEAATVRGVSFPAWYLGLLLIAGLGFSWVVGRQGGPFRHGLFWATPMISAWGVGLGNFGDLTLLRYAVAVLVMLCLSREFVSNVGVRLSFLASGKAREIRITGEAVAIAAVLTFFLYPVAVLVKTTGVTLFAMTGRMLAPDAAGLIKYENLPGFFSHERYIAKRFRVSHIGRERVLPLVRKRKGMKHTATFFTLYAMDLDRAIGFLRPHVDMTMTWVSFPGLSSQVFGVGQVPAKARPWYLWGHEIGGEVGPDYVGIRENSDLMIVDQCSWAPGSIMFREIFDLDDYKNQDAIFSTVCFRAVRGGI